MTQRAVGSALAGGCAAGLIGAWCLVGCASNGGTGGEGESGETSATNSGSDESTGGQAGDVDWVGISAREDFTVLNLADPDATAIDLGGGSFKAWFDDRHTLVFGSSQSLRTLDLSGAEPGDYVDVEAGQPQGFFVSPAGDAFAWRSGLSSLCVTTLWGPRECASVGASRTILNPTWSADGSLLGFPVDLGSGARAVGLARYADGLSAAQELDRSAVWALSPTGDAVAVRFISGADSEIIPIGVDGTLGTPALFDWSSVDEIAWAPDGAALVLRNASQHYVVDMTTDPPGEPQQVSLSNSSGMQFTDDGRWLIYDHELATSSDLWAAPYRDGMVGTETLIHPVDVHRVAVTPDGGHLVIHEDEQILSVDMSGEAPGDPVQVTVTAHGATYVISPDSQRIAWVASDRSIQARAIDASDAPIVLATPRGDELNQEVQLWTPGGTVVYRDGGNEAYEIHAVAGDGSEPSRMIASGDNATAW